MSRLIRRWSITGLAALLCLFIFYRLYETKWEPSSLISKSSYGLRRKISWRLRKEVFPLTSYLTLPTEEPAEIPDIQAVFPNESGERQSWRLKRQKAVKDAFIKSWRAYEKYAWLEDEVTPLTGLSKETFGGWGATLVDALDTLWIMGMEEEFSKAVNALHRIDFTRASREKLNVFETTIRYLGGLLSAYDLSGEKYPVLLEKATDLGDMLYAAFDTPNRFPVTRWYWESAAAQFPQEAPSHALAAEIGSLTLEFTRLSQLTGNPKYFDAVQRISDELERQQELTGIPGLWPVMLDAANLNFTSDNTFTLGGKADSLYEYILKEYLMLGGTLVQYQTMYEKFVAAAKKHLFFRPMIPDKSRDILISGTVRKLVNGDYKLDPEGQHLTCFVGGLLGIGARIFKRPNDLLVAKKLVDGCIWAYQVSPNGIMPELFRTWPCADPENCPWDEGKWYDGVLYHGPSIDSSIKPSTNEEHAKLIIERMKLPKGFTDVRDARYILRPEAIESVFILYRITGDRKYQEVAWNMFAAIKRATETDLSFAALSNVMTNPPSKVDQQESFWMAETLKYFYLIFSEPDLLSLDDFVFNTEAHPLRRPKPKVKQ
ncbi:uncharacterized protein PV09_06571 [Verruconis gallopava]|uniref:alpha-1,2-Mannosidase n=1 Tax=Verruconis gallopava TaxID=253628 RepID=A0A0D1YMV5_9PEZI|nr:uncharacterized protein PV09_06571 [Verruconis gallopava]KIW02077.1 hypothetical protein PV09_06571 [Verruconis gallopava]